MKSFHYFSRTFLKFFFLLILSMALFLGIFLLGSIYNYWQMERSRSNPEHVFSLMKENEQVRLNSHNRALLDKNKLWLIHLDGEGKYIESYRAPKRVQRDYSPQDLIRLTRWYLEDYPVFTFLEKGQIYILAYPPDTYSKFPANYFPIDLFFRSFYLFIISLGLTLIFLFVLYFYSKKKLWEEIQPISQAIEDLSNNKRIRLEASGNLVDIKRALNKTSKHLNKIEQDREIWLRGISHDIRTPLTVISAYAQSLEEKSGVSQEVKKIQDNTLRVQQILEGLNFRYILEHFDPKTQGEYVDIIRLLREISVDVLNEYGDRVQISIDASDKKLGLTSNRDLLDRALRNILYNSALHNKEVDIVIGLKKEEDSLLLTIEDSGQIKEEEVVKLKEKKDNEGSHGNGILIVKKIMEILGAKVDFIYNNPGLKVEILLPLCPSDYKGPLNDL